MSKKPARLRAAERRAGCSARLATRSPSRNICRPSLSERRNSAPVRSAPASARLGPAVGWGVIDASWSIALDRAIGSRSYGVTARGVRIDPEATRERYSLLSEVRGHPLISTLDQAHPYERCSVVPQPSGRPSIFALLYNRVALAEENNAPPRARDRFQPVPRRPGGRAPRSQSLHRVRQLRACIRRHTPTSAHRVRSVRSGRGAVRFLPTSLYPGAFSGRCLSGRFRGSPGPWLRSSCGSLALDPP
jgi:hypothetical protein